MPDLMYKALTQFGDDLHWFCKSCKGGAEKIMGVVAKMQSKVDRIEEELTRARTDFTKDLGSAISGVRNDVAELATVVGAVRNDVSDLGARLFQIEKMVSDKQQDSGAREETWSKTVSKEVETKMSGMQAEVKAMQEDLEEQAEIAKRKTSVIIHGLHEPARDSGDAGWEEDRDQLMDVIHALKCDTVSINTFFRLGKRQEGADSLPRPVKMVVASEEQKTQLLARTKNLKSVKRFEKVFMHPDLTPKQRQKRKELVAELKERKESGELNLVIRNGRIKKREGTSETEQTSDAFTRTQPVC
jgi:DNA-binding protein YbaB